MMGTSRRWGWTRSAASSGASPQTTIRSGRSAPSAATVVKPHASMRSPRLTRAARAMAHTHSLALPALGHLGDRGGENVLQRHAVVARERATRLVLGRHVDHDPPEEPHLDGDPSPRGVDLLDAPLEGAARDVGE